MYRVIACLTEQHNYGLVSIAALVCVVGSYLSVLLCQRLYKSRGTCKKTQLTLASMISGATIWSTHFIAMLAYDPGFEHGYEPFKTALSLFVAVLGMFTSFYILTSVGHRLRFAVAGTVFGLTVSMMHYIGMSAYLLPGMLSWDPLMVLSSVIFGILLGIVCFHRIEQPFTKLCWLGAATLMVVAICSMHFTGMSAFTVDLNPTIQVPPQTITDATLGMVVVFVTSVIFIFGFMSFSIETNIENEALGLLNHAALHDPLTTMPNRMKLDLKIADLGSNLGSDDTGHVAILTIDLNLFKEINDLHGHGVGDCVLTTIADRMTAALQEDEFVFRTGGDEFIALKQGINRIEQAQAFAQRLHGLIIEPINASHISINVGAAVGISTTIEDGTEISDLIHKSDLAMYRAKEETDLHICFFNAKIDQQSRDKLQLVGDLRQALSRNEFELAYQLQNDLSSLNPIGFEALLRWNHPTRGRVSPGEFIPIAEETGLIREIGLWVLRAACKEASLWPENFSIAVNVAPQQLVQPSFLEHVSDILMETQLLPSRLEIEITEASIIDDQAHTLAVMHKLKKMGVRIAMDDFGTGYSSLATLQAFPFDKIKIDRSFIQNVHENHQRAAIVRSTLTLGAALDIPVLAEGVEEQSELDFLRVEKCNSVQGFYFGKPMTLAETRIVINENMALRKVS